MAKIGCVITFLISSY